MKQLKSDAQDFLAVQGEGDECRNVCNAVITVQAVFDDKQRKVSIRIREAYKKTSKEAPPPFGSFPRFHRF